MQLPEYLTIETGYALLCPRGHSSFEDGVERIGNAIEFCREQKMSKMMIDITQVDGFGNRQQALGWLLGKASE